MNIRDIIENPLLPIIQEIKANPKNYWKQRLILTSCGIVSVFLLLFAIRMAWLLPAFLIG